MNLNEAIYEVLTSNYKKDAPAAFKMVQNNGYDVYKSGKSWVVRNHKTYKIVCLDVPSGDWTFYWGRNHKSIDPRWWRNKGREINFVRCLDTPTNNYKCDNNGSKALVKHYEIKCQRNYVKWEQDKIDDIQSQISRLQSELVYHVDKKAREEEQLKKLRKDAGLIH